MKNRIVVLSLLSLFLVWVACDIAKKSPTKSDKTEISFKAEQVKAKLYEDWIERMDPYVVQNNDGTYSLDWDNFIKSIRGSHPSVVQPLQSGGKLTGEAAVVQELRESVQLVNALVQKGELQKALGSACWWYWWGKRCCYWGKEGWQIVAALGTVGSLGSYFLPPFGAVAGALTAYLSYYMSVYGGFCLNQSWGLGMWVTKP